MKMIPRFLLAAFAFAPLQAQVCSGGADGGMSATGTSCNDPTMLSSFDLPQVASRGQTVIVDVATPSAAGSADTLRVAQMPSNESSAQGYSQLSRLRHLALRFMVPKR